MSEVVETGESGGEVTYVGGKAVEQTTQGEAPEGDHGDELAAAKAAVKKALSEEAKEDGKRAAKEAKEARAKDPLVPRDRDADGKFIPNDPVEAERDEAVKALKRETSDAEDNASALRKALAERKETAKYKAEAAAQLERERQEVRQVYQRVQAQERALKAEQEKMALFRKDPIRAIRENGWTNPEEFIMDIAQDGTPEGQAKRAHRELLERLDKAERWQAEQLQERQRQAEEQELHGRRANRENIERQFLAEASKCEHLVGLYKGNEVGLIAQADVVAEQYRNATGKEATFAEIAEYLEERAARWYKNKSGASSVPSQSSQAATQSQSGRPTQGSAGKKSLSPAGSSERRSLGSSYADLDGDERREMAITAVKAAIGHSGER